MVYFILLWTDGVPDLNISDIVLLLPAPVMFIFLRKLEHRKRKPEHYPNEKLQKSAETVRSFKESILMFGALCLCLVFYLPYAYIVFKFLPPPLFFG